MNKFLVLVMFLMVPVLGCAKDGRTEFVTVVQDHRELTTETNEALIRSIEDEMRQVRNDPAAMEALRDLIDRLRMIKRQSDVIDEYVKATLVDEELIAEMIRNRWRR